jgi:hypothetical protein
MIRISMARTANVYGRSTASLVIFKFGSVSVGETLRHPRAFKLPALSAKQEWEVIHQEEWYAVAGLPAAAKTSVRSDSFLNFYTSALWTLSRSEILNVI